MARFVDPPRSRANIDRLVELWKERCLRDASSLLFEEDPVWSFANLQDFRDRFTGSAATYGTDENFEDESAMQIAPSESQTRVAPPMAIWKSN